LDPPKVSSPKCEFCRYQKKIPEDFSVKSTIPTKGIKHENVKTGLYKGQDIISSLRYLFDYTNGDAFTGEGKLPNKIQVVITEVTIRCIKSPTFNPSVWTPPTDLLEMHKAALKEIQSQNNLQQKLNAGILSLFSTWNLDSSDLDLISTIPKDLYYSTGDKRTSSGILGMIVSNVEPFANEIASIVYVGSYFYVNSLYQECRRCSFDITDPSFQIPNPLFYGFVADVLYQFVSVDLNSFAELFQACNIIFGKENGKQSGKNEYFSKLTKKNNTMCCF